ncbi:hypothetical protein EW026_g1177 [Hermanssonia centrifuga]|uniref:Uncharacterized protein n=1 Tax=Hermanssonia centrifuga TaxID=98765 RepID=A0A4S4KU21_9APHY|nr:hypothetical protein EW026_g1177 [Hermanssonia centrifuga]
MATARPSLPPIDSIAPQAGTVTDGSGQNPDLAQLQAELANLKVQLTQMKENLGPEKMGLNNNQAEYNMILHTIHTLAHASHIDLLKPYKSVSPSDLEKFFFCNSQHPPDPCSI